MLSNKEIAINAMLDNHIVLYEFLRCMTGELIGEGCYRYVFDNPFNKSEVIKIDMGIHCCNVTEHHLWLSIKDDPERSKWFAPCVWMSTSGKVLIMKKADTSKGYDLYPQKIPSFFQDVKVQNFGLIGKQLVCVDYGITNMYHTGKTIKMIDVNWMK